MDRTREIILVDMDGVLFDWTSGFYRIAREMAAEQGVVFGLPEPEHLTSFYMGEMIPEGDTWTQGIIDATMAHPELYSTLDPIPGAVEALNEMLEEDEVFVCSTPDSSNVECATAKMTAMKHYFGQTWGKRTILTHDKTLVSGRILIDDKPQIKGILSPRQSWQQIAFSQPYNAGFPGPRMDDWSQWRSVVHPLLGRRP